MRKKLLILLVAISFFFVGCGTQPPIVWDDALSNDQVATIYWLGQYVYPTAYNGIAVTWKITAWGWNVLKLPSGSTTFELGGYWSDATPSYGGTTWYYDGMTIAYDFEAGKVYTVLVRGGTITIHSGKSYANNTVIHTYDLDWNLR